MVAWDALECLTSFKYGLHAFCVDDYILTKCGLSGRLPENTCQAMTGLEPMGADFLCDRWSKWEREGRHWKCASPVRVLLPPDWGAPCVRSWCRAACQDPPARPSVGFQRQRGRCGQPDFCFRGFHIFAMYIPHLSHQLMVQFLAATCDDYDHHSQQPWSGDACLVFYVNVVVSFFYCWYCCSLCYQTCFLFVLFSLLVGLTAAGCKRRNTTTDCNCPLPGQPDTLERVVLPFSVLAGYQRNLCVQVRLQPLGWQRQRAGGHHWCPASWSAPLATPSPHLLLWRWVSQCSAACHSKMPSSYTQTIAGLRHERQTVLLRSVCIIAHYQIRWTAGYAVETAVCAEGCHCVTVGTDQLALTSSCYTTADVT